MKKLMRSNPTLVGSLIIVVSFLLLYFVPKVTPQTRFTFPVPADSNAKTSLDPLALNTSLKIFEGASVLKQAGIKKNKTTIKEILSAVNKNVIVNFWATWCPPCVEEFPSVEYLNRQLSSTKEQLPLLITVSVDENERDIRKFYSTLGYHPSIIVLHDVDGEISRAFGTVKFPETYLLSAKGMVLHKWIGPQNWLSRDVMSIISTL